MTWPTLLLTLLSVSMSAFAQLLLKMGLPNGSIVTGAGIVQTIGRMLTNPWVLGGLSVYFLGAIIWMFVLERSEVSYAYPFVSFGFVLTMILGSVVLGEQIGPGRMVGTLFIVTGIILVARS